MKQILCSFTLCFFAQFCFAQIGINNPLPDPSAALDITSTDKGLLIPRVANTMSVSNPANGLIVFNMEDNHFHYFNGSTWLQLVSDRGFLSDADADTKILVESMPDEDVIRLELAGTEKFTFVSDAVGRSRINFPENQDNIAIGDEGMKSNVGGDGNVVVGMQSFGDNISGNDNSAYGYLALQKNTTGSNNVAIGRGAMRENTTGGANVVVGAGALNNNNGFENTAIGTAAMSNSISASRNVAVGNAAMRGNTTGNNNVSIGFASMLSSTTGGSNIAIGTNSLRESDNGNNNVAIGINAMQFNQSGGNNTALGINALMNNGGGNKNVAIGSSALLNLTDGTGNVAIGVSAGQNATGSNQLYINNDGGTGEDILIYGDFTQDIVIVNDRLAVGMPLADFNLLHTLSLQGNSSSDTLIHCENNTGDLRFQVYSDGDAWLSGTLTEASDKRLKKNIVPLSSSLAGILALNGYNYDWKNPLSSTDLQTGVIAQEVLEVFPELVVTDKEYYSVNYTGLIPHLIEGTKTQQALIDEQQKEIEEMKSEIEALRNLLEQVLEKAEE